MFWDERETPKVAGPLGRRPRPRDLGLEFEGCGEELLLPEKQTPSWRRQEAQAKLTRGMGSWTGVEVDSFASKRSQLDISVRSGGADE